MCVCVTNTIHHLLPRHMPTAHDFPVLHLEVQWETRSQTCHLGYNSRMLLLHLPLLLPGKLSWRVCDIVQVSRISHFVQTCFPQIETPRMACRQCIHLSLTECIGQLASQRLLKWVLFICSLGVFTRSVHLEVLGCFSMVYPWSWMVQHSNGTGAIRPGPKCTLSKLEGGSSTARLVRSSTFGTPLLTEAMYLIYPYPKICMTLGLLISVCWYKYLQI